MKKDEISSTEKLLELIRGDSPTADSPVPEPPPAEKQAAGPVKAPAPAATPSAAKPSLKKPGLFKLPGFSLPSPPTPALKGSRTVVGIDIGYQELRLISVFQGDSTWKVLGHQTIPFDPQYPRESPKFADFLKKSLAAFCISLKKPELWSSISSANVELRNFRISQVPKKQLTNTVFWTYKKDVPTFNEKESIFDFVVQRELTDKGLKKIDVLAYSAPKKEVQALRTLFADIGYPLTGISIAPLALQNIFMADWLGSDKGKALCNLYIGRDWSRIDIYADGNLALIRGIKTGINSMTEEIVESGTHDTDSTGLELELSLADDESPSFSLEEESHGGPISPADARKILFSLCADSPPPAGADAAPPLSEDKIFELIMPAVERLLRQVERTIEHYASTFGGLAVSKIYVSGQLDTYGRLVNHIGEQLGLASGIIDPLSPDNPRVNRDSVPRELAARVTYTPALGLALSDNVRTPNFLFTYKDKEKYAVTARVDKVIFIAFLAAVVACTTIFFWQGYIENKKNSELAQAQQKLGQYSIALDQNFILQLSAKVNQKKNRKKTYGQRYLGMATINELAALTPEEIALTRCTFQDPLPNDPTGIAGDKRNPGRQTTAPSTPQGGKTEEETITSGTVLIEGIVRNDTGRMESILAGYMISLEGSPLLDQPVLQSSNYETYQDKEVLFFSILTNTGSR